VRNVGDLVKNIYINFLKSFVCDFWVYKFVLGFRPWILFFFISHPLFKIYLLC
jgi:hypothetical protein